MGNTITTYRSGNSFVLKVLSDSLNINNFKEISAECAEAIQSVVDPRITIDLKNVRYIDSVGVGLLTRIKKKLAEHNICLAITGLN